MEPNWRALPAIAKAVTGFAKIYHRYRIRGLETLPPKGPALLVFYHGLVPLDFYYFGLQVYQETGRLPRALGDRWLFKTPGMAQVARTLGAVEGAPGAALQLLRAGELVGVAPGGVREAISGPRHDYKLMWKDRKGFAKVALDAGVPVIPGFTENVESLYRAPLADRPFFRHLYEVTRLPLVPIIGIGPMPFPAKLTTWLGEPIHAMPGETPDALAGRTRGAIENLIRRHQLR